MVEHLDPRPEALSPGPDMTTQRGIPSPPSPRATPTATTPDHKHADALHHSHDSYNPPRRPSVTPQASPVIDVRPGRLKREAPSSSPASRENSPGSARSASPDMFPIPTLSEKLEALKNKVRGASAPRFSPRSPPPNRQKGKEPADCPPSPLADGDSDATSLRSATPDPHCDDDDDDDDDSLHDAAPGTPTHSAPVVPPAKQLEIDNVISRLPPPVPRIEPDPSANIAVDERLQIDEGFFDETLEAHYEAFVQATEELRSRQRPYYRVRTPGAENGSSLVQRRVVQKNIRMRRRGPKEGNTGGAAVGAADAVASSSAA